MLFLRGRQNTPRAGFRGIIGRDPNAVKCFSLPLEEIRKGRGDCSYYELDTGRPRMEPDLFDRDNIDEYDIELIAENRYSI